MKVDGRLAGKTCLITGSAGPVGRVAAIKFAAEGARVVGADLDADGDQETVRLVREAGGVMSSFGSCNLNDWAQCQALAHFAVATYGKLDVLVNNASNVRFGWMSELSPADWVATMDGELNQVFLTTRAAWAALADGGGTVVNVGSTAAWLGYKMLGSVAHCAAKAGVVAMTRQLAVEGRHHGIRANSVSPGVIETYRNAEMLKNPQVAAAVTENIMRGRPGLPEEVANIILFLASDESSYINGADILADGGATAW